MHTRNWMLASLTATAVCLYGSLDFGPIGQASRMLGDGAADRERARALPSTREPVGLVARPRYGSHSRTRVGERDATPVVRLDGRDEVRRTHPERR